MFGAAPSHYEVRPGDTLYSIAWRYGLDTETLARRNQLVPPYRLTIGQHLQLKPAPSVAKRSVGNPTSMPTKPSPTAGSKPSTLEASRWRWPVPGESPTRLVERPFHVEQPGITFRLDSQPTALAAASGEVVYAGNGLGGFAKLIILRHVGALLSAYSFDGRSLVAEGERVKVGDSLADISAAGSRGLLLYFELRRNGSPIDPVRVIR